MKTTRITNRHYQIFVYERAYPTRGWQPYSYERKTLAQARKATKNISLRFEWRIAYVQTVYKFISQSPRRKKEKCLLPKNRVPACRQWPNCACIVRGNVRQCVVTPRPFSLTTDV